ncbi:hypothetical protein [Pelagerythrobacter aerophilus]|uniref:hypothetical protein n=1 Tax=Pelagerythrobacter aerophilus TaxID=2306995 RepID=UPI0011C44585|nr:hypothetical protein [Pelagerythrobacter aerophilus]
MTAKKGSDRSLAIEGRELIEKAIMRYLATRPLGAINNEIAKELGLESDFQGRQKNYLTYSVLGGLMKRGLVERKVDGTRKAFVKVSKLD